MIAKTPARVSTARIMFAAAVWLAGACNAALAQEEGGAQQEADEVAATTITYDAEFIARFPNVVSVLDLSPRIPGAEQILGDPQTRRFLQRRGFSGNEDSVLINGKRISGKSNDSRSALGRITIDQVERIEIIRGSNPDIKVSSQRGIINVVLKEGASSGSGAWRVLSRAITNSGNTRFGGFLSYGGSLGRLEYFVSAEVAPRHRTITGSETSFAADGSITEFLDEPTTRRRSDQSFAANLTYSFDNGDQMHLNGAFEEGDFTDLFEGRALVPDGMGGLGGGPGGMLVFDGNSRRVEAVDSSDWEIGGDYETRFGEALKFKLLALYSSAGKVDRQREDLRTGSGGEVAYDVISVSDEPATEAIGRASLSWSINKAHELEFGSELAINTLDVDLDLQERIGGVLTDVDVFASDVKIKETRNESFLIHSWTLSPKLSLESALFIEWSRLSQQGEDVTASRDFFFLRPTVDLRYDITPRDQFQLSLRRDIAQLDFRDFATSVSRDDDIIAGNADLVQEKSWIAEVSFEHRTKGGGRFKISALNRLVQDYKTKIEINPGVSGVGNAGAARFSQLILEGSWPAVALGLPDLKFEGELRFRSTSVTDPFTGLKHRMDFVSRVRSKFGFRHDITDWGVSYGVTDEFQGREPFFDIDEIIIIPSRHQVTAFAEGKVFYGATLRLELRNAANTNFGRNRILFANGRRAPPTGNELRVRHSSPSIKISLRGNF